MPFLGSQPADQYQSLAKQTITGDGSTSYTLNRSVTNAYDMEVFINNVRQEPDTSYSASGNTITFTAAVTASDSCYLIYQGQSVGSINPPSNSVGGAQIQNGSVTHAKLHSTTLNPITLDQVNNRVGIGTTTPAKPLSVVKAGGGDYVAEFQNTTSGTPYGVHIKDAGAGSNGYPLIAVTGSTGVSTYFRVDSGTGYVTKPYQPAFRVGKTSSDTSSGGNFIDPVTFQQTDFNIGNHFSLSTNKFTAPIAGRYMFSWSVSVHRNSAAYTGVYSYVNNAYLDWTNSFQYSAPSWFPHDACIIVNLAANDTFHIVGRHDSNATIDNSGWFAGYFLG